MHDIASSGKHGGWRTTFKLFIGLDGQNYRIRVNGRPVENAQRIILLQNKIEILVGLVWLPISLRYFLQAAVFFSSRFTRFDFRTNKGLSTVLEYYAHIILECCHVSKRLHHFWKTKTLQSGPARTTAVVRIFRQNFSKSQGFWS